MATFIHAADLHIGLGVTRFDEDRADRVRGARIQAMENILSEASKRGVDFLLIAGDLFDDARIDGVTADRTFRILENSDVPVFVLPGNHDPLQPGSVWNRPPWDRQDAERIKVLRRPEPVAAPGNVVLFPCPVLRRTSLQDPTSWIPKRSESNRQGEIRVGVAHGSIRDRENLPPDDHLISLHAASDKGLDYLALGHWHSKKLFRDEDGTCRTAYPGVHEPMSFSDAPELPTGWVAYVTDSSRPDFYDGGMGQALLVEIARAGSPPRIQPLAVKHLEWASELCSVRSGEDMGRLISRVARRDLADRTLLRLRLEGTLGGRAMLRLDELEAVFRERYLYWELDRHALHLEPDEEEIRELVGRGVLRSILERLFAEIGTGGTMHEADETARKRRIAERAIMILYRIALEVQQ